MRVMLSTELAKRSLVIPRVVYLRRVKVDLRPRMDSVSNVTSVSSGCLFTVIDGVGLLKGDAQASLGTGAVAGVRLSN